MKVGDVKSVCLLNPGGRKASTEITGVIKENKKRESFFPGGSEKFFS